MSKNMKWIFYVYKILQYEFKLMYTLGWPEIIFFFFIIHFGTKMEDILHPEISFLKL